MLGAALLSLAGPARADTLVSVELLLAIDVSASVDDAEFALQARGIGAAFRSEALIDLIGRHPGGVAVAVMPWSGWPAEPEPGDWVLVSDAASAQRFASEVEAMRRPALGSRTAIGLALGGGVEALSENGFTGLRQVIDLSGDGRSNAGPAPVAGRTAALARGITVNGLAVRTDDAGLDAYFRRWVIGGPGAFVAAVEGYQDFPAAILAKLLRELALTPELSGPGNDFVPNL